MAEVISLKTVIRTRSFETSKKFYTEILNLQIIQKYNDGDGSSGVMLRLGSASSNAFLEISEIKSTHYYYQQSFSKSIENDKLDIQLRTHNIEEWATRLEGKWDFRGPVLKPWGWYYLYLRDPDGLQIIIYEEKESNG